MSDRKKYVEKRKARDPEFVENCETGYLEFKIGVSPATSAGRGGKKLNIQRSVISKIENHAEDIRLSTLGKYAKVVGKSLHFSVG